MSASVLVTAALSAAGAGLFAAGHAASWGAFKDSPFEGFRPWSYARTLVLGVVVAGALSWWLPVTSAASVAVLIGVTYGLERLCTEWWKSIVRNEDQAAYTIPMRLGLFGRPVERRAARYTVGAVIAVIVAAGLVGVHVLQGVLPPVPWWVSVSLIGGIGGWATAVGGAWKDAPIEGFSFAKFLRSPVVATAWALPLTAMTTSWAALVLAAAGYAVISIETYKTFFIPGRPPGKFAGKPVRALLPRLRRTLAVQAAAWWAAFATLLVLVVAALGADGSGLVLQRLLLAVMAAGGLLVAAALARAGRVQMLDLR